MALVKTHVQQSEDGADSPLEDNSDQSDLEENSNDGGGGSDGDDADSGSDGENEEEDDDDNDDDGGEEEDEETGDVNANANAGWAEAMAKILGKKTSESKSSLLTNNKELKKIKEKDRQQQLEKKTQVDKKRAWEMMFREKPDVVKDREAERALQRIATRGVVQLFNAMRKHQKTVNDKVKDVGGSERKKAKILSSVSKKDFIDVLRRTDERSRVTVKTEGESEKPAWSVLRDDFMMGATMKDWDKDSDTEEAGTHAGGGE